MAEGRPDTPAEPSRKYLWTELFRSFQIALDPRKLLAAAAGILAMSFGWYVLSAVFVPSKPPEPEAAQYTKVDAIKKEYGEKKKPDGKEFTEEEYLKLGKEMLAHDQRQWATLYSLAGSGSPESRGLKPDAPRIHPGKLRTMPWHESRGENPFLFAMALTDAPASKWVGGGLGYILAQVPVLTEPLNKLFLIITKIADPDASFLTRVYLLLCLVWSVAVWAFFGGIITRLAAVQFGGKERISIKQAVQFVKERYVSYLLSPLVPLIVIAVIVFCMSLYGLVALVPILGDVVLYGIGLPLVILGGIVITILLIGLVGYPMMNATVSTEGSDTFDALSRSYNYVFQAPWQYLWYIIVSVVYGVFVTFVVLGIGCLMVYFGKWAVSQPANLMFTDRKPDFLFVYSPKSLGWRELMLKGSPAEIALSPKTGDYEPVNPEASAEYMKQMTWWNEAGAGMTTFWMVLVFLLMIGFIYSYFWTSSTMIYLLMRKKVDEVDLDEVFSQQDAEGTVAPPTGPPGATVSAGGSVSLPTVPPPAAVPTPPVEPTPPSTGAVPPKDVPPPPDAPKV
jgi:hypothetical protein